MWQKKRIKLTKVGAIFIILYALLIQRPQTGLSMSLHAPHLDSAENDISSVKIYAYQQGKMKLAEEKPLPTSTPTQTPQPQVASFAIEKPQPTPTPQPTETPVIEPSVVENTSVNVEDIIRRYAFEYSVDPEIMIAIAHCESGLRETAVNGQYAGIYQFHPSTWQSNRRAMGLDDSTSLRFNAEEAAKTAAYKMSRDGFGAWPECGSKALLAAK